MRQSIESYIHRKVVILHEKDTLSQAAKAMAAQGVGCVVVSDHHGHLTGIVTDRDVTCRAVAEGLGLGAPLSEVMSSEIVSATENSDLNDVIERMAKFGVRRIPILREGKSGFQRCVGLIALDDLLVADAIDNSSLQRIVRSQIQRRAGHGVRMAETELGGASKEFIAQLARHLSTDEQKVRDLCAHFFGGLTQRLNYSAGVQFVLRLPFAFQKELLELPPGPNRMVSAQSLTEEAAEILSISSPQARQALRRVWEFLRRFTGSGELDHTLNQLPSEIVEMLISPSSTSIETSIKA